MWLFLWAALLRTRSCARRRPAKNVASFRVACDRGRRDANGQNQADFFDVVAWDRSAEFVCRYFQKGSMIAIDGRLQSRNYQDKSGNNRTAIEIVASNINFVTPKSQNPAAGMGAPMASAPIPAAPADYSRPAAQPLLPPIRLAATMTLH